MMMLLSMLTTIDNPFDPFDSFNEWAAWDTKAGYHCSGLLARIAVVSHETSELDQHQAIDEAIDEIIRENTSGMFKKVTREVPDSALS